jgi:hypothetical protein
LSRPCRCWYRCVVRVLAEARVVQVQDLYLPEETEGK